MIRYSRFCHLAREKCAQPVTLWHIAVIESKRYSSSDAMDKSSIKEKTRYDIHKAAYELISEKGLFAITFVDIADKASLSRRTLYNHYPTLDKLCKELQQEVLQKSLTGLLDKAGRQFLPDKQVMAFFRNLYNRLEQENSSLKYLIKVDHYLIKKPDFLPGDLSFKNYLLQKSPIPPLLEKITGSKLQAGKLSVILVESFMAYLERITFRRSAFLAESPIRLEDFHYYLDSLSHLLDKAGGKC